MASTEDMAPASSRTASSRARASTSKASAELREAELEQQIGQLRTDLKAIADTLSKLTGDKVSEARALARTEASNLQRQAQHVVDDMQETASLMESELKKSIREKPFSAVAAAAGIGFLFALLTRR